LRAGTLADRDRDARSGCVDASLALDDPLEALHTWSADLSLRARAQTIDGSALRPSRCSFAFSRRPDSSRARAAWRRGARAHEILALWEDTLIKLRDGDFAALARRLDWVLKLQILRRAIGATAGPDVAIPQIKHLDHLYASLDDTDGLFWAYEAPASGPRRGRRGDRARDRDATRGHTSWTRPI